MNYFNIKGKIWGEAGRYIEVNREQDLQTFSTSAEIDTGVVADSKEEAEKIFKEYDFMNFKDVSEFFEEINDVTIDSIEDWGEEEVVDNGFPKGLVEDETAIDIDYEAEDDYDGYYDDDPYDDAYYEKQFYKQIGESDKKALRDLRIYENKVKKEIATKRENLIKEAKANIIAKGPFGFLKQTFEEIASESLDMKGIAAYTKLIKEDKDLQTLHRFYEAIRKINESDVSKERMISEAVLVAPKLSKNYKTSVAKLGRLVKEAYVKHPIPDASLPQDTTAIDEAAEYLLAHNHNLKNLSRFSECVGILSEGVKHDETKESSKQASENFVDTIVEHIDTKTSNDLDFTEIVSKGDPAKLFEEYKSSCIKRIQEVEDVAKKRGDKEMTDWVKDIKDKVSAKVYCEESAWDDIYNLRELGKLMDAKSA